MLKGVWKGRETVIDCVVKVCGVLTLAGQEGSSMYTASTSGRYVSRSESVGGDGRLPWPGSRLQHPF